MSALVDILTLFRGGSSVVEGQQASVPAGSYPASEDLFAGPASPQQADTTASDPDVEGDPDAQALEELKEALKKPSVAENDGLPELGPPCVVHKLPRGL